MTSPDLQKQIEMEIHDQVYERVYWQTTFKVIQPTKDLKLSTLEKSIALKIGNQVSIPVYMLIHSQIHNELYDRLQEEFNNG